MISKNDIRYIDQRYTDEDRIHMPRGAIVSPERSYIWTPEKISVNVAVQDPAADFFNGTRRSPDGKYKAEMHAGAFLNLPRNRRKNSDLDIWAGKLVKLTSRIEMERIEQIRSAIIDVLRKRSAPAEGPAKKRFRRTDTEKEIFPLIVAADYRLSEDFMDIRRRIWVSDFYPSRYQQEGGKKISASVDNLRYEKFMKSIVEKILRRIMTVS